MDHLSHSCWWSSSYFVRLHDRYCQLCYKYTFANISFFKQLNFDIFHPLLYYLNYINLPSHQWCCSGVFVINFGHFSHFSDVSIVDFEQVNAGWVVALISQCSHLFFFPLFSMSYSNFIASVEFLWQGRSFVLIIKIIVNLTRKVPKTFSYRVLRYQYIVFAMVYLVSGLLKCKENQNSIFKVDFKMIEHN